MDMVALRVYSVQIKYDVGRTGADGIDEGGHDSSRTRNAGWLDGGGFAGAELCQAQSESVDRLRCTRRPRAATSVSRRPRVNDARRVLLHFTPTPLLTFAPPSSATTMSTPQPSTSSGMDQRRQDALKGYREVCGAVPSKSRAN